MKLSYSYESRVEVDNDVIVLHLEKYRLMYVGRMVHVVWYVCVY